MTLHQVIPKSNMQHQWMFGEEGKKNPLLLPSLSLFLSNSLRIGGEREMSLSFTPRFLLFVFYERAVWETEKSGVKEGVKEGVNVRGD